ncbi:hypothetical protein C6502_01910 [Candidatus Poribacteria bacterium]|nr:MAG: hypothetical protein C6502_01910 [Candidatus Poribacteria bacterium]
MDTKESIRKELVELHTDGLEIGLKFFNKDKEQNFYVEYQEWYTSASRVIRTLANERYAEFISYYEIDPKRKELGYGTYVIQDYMKEIVPNRVNYPNFDARDRVAVCFRNQLNILRSVVKNIETILESIDVQLLSELQDAELETAHQLMKVNLRAAGALAGVVVEHHLQKVASNHGLKIRKKSPTISDLSQLLKSENLIDTPTWRKIGYLADIRNICSHKKEVEPTKEQIAELIDGANWLIKNVF